MACNPGSEQTDPVDPALEQYVLGEPPEAENSTFIDFGGKAHLIGYDAEPADRVEPGGALEVTLYWKSVSELEEGWKLFTHVLNEYGVQLGQYDNVGPLRSLSGADQALPPSKWEPGKYYVDVQQITLPQTNANAPWRRGLSSKITLTTGVWMADLRLDILSGPHDAQNRGIVAHFATGLERPEREEAAVDSARAHRAAERAGGNE